MNRSFKIKVLILSVLYFVISIIQTDIPDVFEKVTFKLTSHGQLEGRAWKIIRDSANKLARMDFT